MGIETLRQMLAEATDRLKDAGIETARYDARLLFAEACGTSPRDIDKALLMGDGFEASDRQLADFRSMMDRRASREPLQYIVGHVPFRYLNLQVGPGVFIPRQETEVVVQAGIDWLTREGLYAPKVVDLCAGSGAIGLSIVTEVRGAEVWAVEKYPETLAWTKRNAKLVAGNDPAAGYNYHLQAGDATDTTTLAALDGDFYTAADLQLRLLPLTEALFSEVNPIPVKAAMALLGYDCGPCRLPLTPVSPELRTRLEALLRQFA